MTFEVSATPEARVCQWVENVTAGAESVMEFGAGLFTYIKCVAAPRRAGIELFEPYCNAVALDPDCAGIDIYKGDMRHFELLTFDEFDVALFVDSLEHLSKGDGLRLIRQCKERFKKIAIFVPLGFHKNPICDDNKLQLHQSAWDDAELRDLGFTVGVDLNFHRTNPPEKQAAMFAVWIKE